MEYVNFDLTIESKRDNCYKVKVDPPWAAKECLGEILFSDSRRTMLARLEQSFCDDEESLTLIDLEQLKEFGAILYEALFHGAIRDAFNLALGSVIKEEDKGLRIKLMIEPPEIAELPWELMFDKTRGRFLSTWNKTSITRYLEIPSYPTNLTANFPLQVLVVIPEEVGDDQQPLDKTAERRIVESAFKELEDSGMVKLDFLEGSVSTTTINDKLNDDYYHIFHFIGHGCLFESYGYVKLNPIEGQEFDAQNELEKLGWARSDSFANLFNNHTSMKLVVLNSCQGAQISTTKPLAGLAPQLFSKNIPAVVAMQFPFFDDSAIIFSREFYRKLCRGRQRGLLDTAMINARNKIQTDRRNGIDFATPVLLTHTDGLIFDLKDTSAEEDWSPQPEESVTLSPSEEPSLAQTLSRRVVNAVQTVDETPRLKAVRQARSQNLELLKQQRELVTDYSKRLEIESHIKQEQKEVAEVDHRLLNASSASLGITGSAFGAALVLLLAAVFGVFNVVGVDDMFQRWLSSVSGNSRTMESFGRDQVRVILVDPANREIEGFPSSVIGGDRRFHASLIDALAKAGARVIALDLYFEKENEDADDELALAIERANTNGSAVIVGVKGVTDDGQPLTPMPQQLRAPLDGRWGNITVGIEYELAAMTLSGFKFVLRHIELGKPRTDGEKSPGGGSPVTPSLILQALMQSSSGSDGEVPQPFFYYNESPYKIKLVSPSGEVVRDIPVVDDEMSFMLSGASDAEFDRVRSVYQEVYKKRDDSDFMSQSFRNKVVFVGYGVDNESRYISGKRPKYGVEIQANALANIFEGVYVKRVPWMYNLAIILVMLLVGFLLQTRYAKPLSRGFNFDSPTLRKFLRIPIGLLAVTILYFIMVYFVYRNTVYVVDMTYHIGALFIGYWLPGLSEIRNKKQQFDRARLEFKQQKETEEVALVNAI